MAGETENSASIQDSAKGAISKAISSVKNSIGGAVNTVSSGSFDDRLVGGAGLATSISGSLLGLREKSYSEVILDAIGVSIPLPSQSQVYNFYYELELSKGSIKENEKPINELAYLDPKDWPQPQYLKYQSDYRKYQASLPYKNLKRKAGESKAKAIKRTKSEVNSNKRRFNALIELYKDFNTDLNENIEKDVPADLRAKGIQTFPELFGVIGKSLAKLMFTSLAAATKESGIEYAEAKQAELLQKLGVTDLTEVDPDLIKQTFCPTQESLDRIIEQRNGMVTYLNNQQERINNLKIPIELSGDLLDFTQRTSTRIKAVTAIVNAGLALIPLAVLGNPIISFINLIGTIRETILVDNNMVPRIPKLQGAISNVNIPLNQLSRLITKIVLELSKIDDIINLCRPSAELNALTPEILATVAIQLSSDLATTDDNLYKGFRLEIETRPYTDTVNQNKAVAKNQSGIVTLETDWSFASDPNILIRELQFRIDTGNLVSY
jgi:hypothetical protein